MTLVQLFLHDENVIVETATNLTSTTLILAQALADSSRRGVARTLVLDEAILDEA